MSRIRRIAKNEVPSHTFFVYVLYRNHDGELHTDIFGPYLTQGGAKSAAHTIRRGYSMRDGGYSIWVQGFKLVQDGPIQEVT